MALKKITAPGSIFTIAILAISLVVVALPAAAQTDAASDDGASSAVVDNTIVHNTWSSGTAMPTATSFAVAGAIGKNIYVVGGSPTIQYQFTGANDIYNTAKKTWTTGAPDPTARALAAAAVVNGILYVIGGYDGGALNVVDAYDPVSNTWSKVASLPTARWGLSAVVDKDIIYTIGGYAGGGELATVESYNTTTDIWTEEAPLLVAKSYPAVGLLGATIVAADGYVPPFIGDNEGYNVKKNTWAKLTADPTPRAGGCFSAIGGKLYVAGGSNGSGSSLSVNEVYSSKTKSWTTLAAMPDATDETASAEVGGRLYCFGGYSGSTVFDYVQIYQP